MAEFLPSGHDATGPSIWSREATGSLHARNKLAPRKHSRHNVPTLSTIRSASRIRVPKPHVRSGTSHLHNCNIRALLSGARHNDWAVYGRYVERAKACVERSGFTASRQGVSVEQTLDRWQDEGDQRLIKIVVSPAATNEPIDWERLGRELMAGLQRDYRLNVEWVAAIHRNTKHTHLHIALRGVDVAGREHDVSQHYLRTRFQLHARQAVTSQAGYRAAVDRSLEPHPVRARQRAIVQEHTQERSLRSR